MCAVISFLRYRMKAAKQNLIDIGNFRMCNKWLLVHVAALTWLIWYGVVRSLEETCLSQPPIINAEKSTPDQT